ncbi:MAG: hypothetical protein ACRD3D_02145 [Terriglobia bacterium]
MKSKYACLFLASALLLTLPCAHLSSQERSVTHHNGSVTVVINDPRPLAQAITAVSEEYGWVVDYEEPPWQSSRDLRDMSPAAWHAAHPGKRGFMIPAGGAFQSTYTEGPDMWGSATREEQILDKVVSDYNNSNNPGKFLLRQQSDGSYAVIGDLAEDNNGSEVPVGAYLDTVITIPSATRSADTTVDLILSAVSAKTGIVGRQGGLGSINLMRQSTITVGGANEPARELLIQVAHAMGLKMVWDLWYLPDLQKYALKLRPAVLAEPGTFGQKRLVPIGPMLPAGSAGPQ